MSKRTDVVYGNPQVGFPELDVLKKKYKGRTFLFCWLLNTDIGGIMSGKMETDLHYLALSVLFENRQTKSKPERRKLIKEEMKKYYKKEDYHSNSKLTSLLIAYLCTCDGPEKFINDNTNPELGIMVFLDLEGNEEMWVRMLPKVNFLQDYERMKRTGTPFMYF